MKKNSVSRFNAAISIRDAALMKLKNEGQFEDTDFGPLLTWSEDELEISHHTLFQTSPPPSKDVLREYCEAGMDPELYLLHNINIWGTQGKVLNIMWNYNNHVELVSFKRGEWEQEVLHHI